jgi:predicted nucleic acid-binding protein
VIVLDTNVLSEALRPIPDPRPMDWLGRQSSASLFVTTITQAEILYGIAALAPGRRRDDLQTAATAMFAEDFAGRILGFDTDTAPVFAALAAERRRLGRPISQFDAQIASITRSRGAALATRNQSDFEACGIDLIDPWRDA